MTSNGRGGAGHNKSDSYNLSRPRPAAAFRRRVSVMHISSSWLTESYVVVERETNTALGIGVRVLQVLGFIVKPETTRSTGSCNRGECAWDL